MTTPEYFSSGSKKISDSSQIAEHFNNFFANIGTTLAKRIPTSDKTPSIFLNKLEGNFNRSLFLSQVTTEEVDKILSKLTDSAPGEDEIKPIIVKEVREYLILPLTYICNLSFDTATFPQQLKQAKIIPIFKKDDDKKFTNYRPISLLSVFSKLLERTMVD